MFNECRRSNRLRSHWLGYFVWMFGVLLLLAPARQAHAQAMSYDATSQASGQTNNLSWTHTSAPGENRLLLVTVLLRNNVTPTNVTVSGVESGTTVTKTAKYVGHAGKTASTTGNDSHIYLYYVANPPQSSTSSSTSLSISTTLSSKTQVVCGALSFVNVNLTETTPGSGELRYLSVVTNFGRSNLARLATPMPSQEGSIIVDFVTPESTANSITPAAGQYTAWNTLAGNGGTGNNSGIIGAGGVRVATGGTIQDGYTLPYTGPNPPDWAYMTLALKGSVEPSGNATIDASSSAKADATQLTWDHTIGFAMERILVVGVSTRGGDATVQNVELLDETGAVYNKSDGTPYTFQGGTAAGHTIAVPGSSGARVTMYYLTNPPGGKIKIRVTMSALCSIVGGAVSVWNVNQATPVGSFVSNSDSVGSTNPNLSVTAATRDLIVDTVAIGANSSSLASTGATQTQRWLTNTTGGTVNVLGSGSTQPGTGGISTLSWGPNSANSVWAMGSYALQGSGTVPTAIRLAEFNAFVSGNGTRLSWRTGFEARNLGFNVYRDAGNGLAKVNDDLIAGSALLAGPSATFRGGFAYEWFDSASEGLATYWLEDVDLDGSSTLHGPFTAKYQPYGGRVSAFSPTLRVLNARTGAGDVFHYTGPVRRIAQVQLSGAKKNKKKRGPQSLASDPIKIIVREEGWYRITQQQLMQAGIDPNTSPRNLQLSVDGQPVPILVTGGNGARLTPKTTIEFYGVGLDTPTSDGRAYWLTTEVGTTQRLATYRGRNTGTSAIAFPHTVERRERRFYFPALNNGEAENWFGPLITQTSTDQALTVQHLYPSPTGKVELHLALQGVTNQAHHVQIRLNGQPLGEARFSNTAYHVASLAIPQAALVNGENTVQLVALGGKSDFSLLDWVRLTHLRTYEAEGGRLRFTAKAGQLVELTGVSRNVRILDITNPDAPFAVTPSAVVKRQNAVKVPVPGTAGQTRLLLAVDEGSEQQPVSVTSRPASQWNAKSNEADLVILTTAALRSAVEPLKQRREAQGLKVVVVDVEDVYDEFSGGHKSPFAIRDFFLATQTAWKKQPRFALLFGDASADMRGYRGNPAADVIPTQSLWLNTLEAPTDDWLVDFNSDAVPDIAIGRLPVSTVAQATTAVQKLLAYENAPRTDGWSRRVLMVADADQDHPFSGYASYIGSLLSSTFTVQGLQRGTVADSVLKNTLRGAIEAGQLAVNYFGHGSIEVWSGGILDAEGASSLQNGARLPLFVNMTCLNGLFTDPDRPSLAKSLMNAPQGGAVAVWASSAFSLPYGQMSMCDEFYRSLFKGGATLGEAAAAAKAATQDPAIRRSWILFGDPTLRIR